MKNKQLLRILSFSILALAAILSGCGLAPQMTYQGRLTDAGGNPLNGQYRMRFMLYHDDNTGSPIYTETKTVQVEDGLFDVVVGPTSAGSGLTSEDMMRPLWLEVEVANGVYTETLSPRQRLYGAPYAFTLMPGAVISEAMESTIYGAAGLEAVLTVGNGYDGDIALPALRVSGEKGLELTGFPDEMGGGINGTIYSDLSDMGSDLLTYSHDDIWFYLDTDNNEEGSFSVTAGNGMYICTMLENGNLNCRGTITGNALRTTASVGGTERAFYGVQSPQAWTEDFGTAQLKEGSAFVAIEPLFAEAVELDTYHVFLTPLGETSGLYVARKTPAGFEVREVGDGRANVAFDYRIVARPANDAGERMPLVELPEQGREGGRR